MAVVYLAEDLRLGREVAIKAMHPHLADDENFTRRFEQEARSAAGLAHPNVVNVFDQGISHGVPYLVMEYLPGITLRDLLKQQHKLTPEQASEIGEAVLAGLAAAHSAGFVHRDLKPENVLLSDDGRIKIGDFGLARAVSANTTTGQALLGTIAYLSPELVTRGIADERSDIYAFGIMFFEMLTGKQPYSGEQPMQIAYQHAHSDVPAPSSIAPELTPELDELVRWCTQREPDGRPSNAAEALEYLKALNTATPLAATSVLAATTVLSGITPSTAVLSGAEQQAIVHAAHTPEATPPSNPVSAATLQAQRRSKRGAGIAAIIAVLIAVAAGAGWWWGQGPGSLVTVPQVTGLEMTTAESRLKEANVEVDVFECASIDIAIGLAVRTEPVSGTRVEQGSTVRLCRSTGPAMLPAPQLTGMTLAEAEQAITEAGFAFGKVVEQRFGEAPRDTVILAIDPAGAQIPETYPEQAVIDLIMSAGAVPEVAGLTAEAAATTLQGAGLGVDANQNSSEHSDSVAEGRVIRLNTTSETLKVGDTVGLTVSLGPELFAVPDLAGQTIREAVAALEAAGFAYDVSAGPALWDLAEVTRTEPKAGSMVARGSTVTIRWQLFG